MELEVQDADQVDALAHGLDFSGSMLSDGEAAAVRAVQKSASTIDCLLLPLTEAEPYGKALSQDGLVAEK